ncbi:M14 family zinc carboxypeptidase [Sphingomonas sp. M1-B02]|uniref:M14 family zinc carboxypeptidase n=1 Tax=Sphingomonas sp. M1-B02 TaxID=3114300 RepID=UPI00223FEDC2|nr:M14 family zinc carboxypeptidase [Sphingomonas sp. S6-11]UZK66608.1 M14 family zinc carboxypeptidase [Sphingomonas sp. S6-11]
MKRSISILLTASSLAMATQAAAQTMDPDFAKSVKEWTTRPEFMSPLVDHLPLSETIPSPKKALGDHIGVPNKLHSQEQIVAYFRQLAAAAPDRVKILDLGKTNEGRDNIVVMLSSAPNMAKLDTYKANIARLADPRKLSATEATQLISQTKPIYHITAGLHSAETGPPEMTMELAYRLLTEDSELIRKIRDNLIVAISPVLEGDGRSRYVDWYHQSLIDETNDLDKPGGPPYWGKYIYHDNNRDMNYSDPSARQLLKYYLEWHPPIMHELHESVPFLYTYSGQSPQNPDLDPILYGELPFYSNFEMSQLTKYGMPGVWTHGFVDAWSPGYVGFMSSNHNGMLRMYETYGNGGATTMLRHVDNGADQSGVRGGNQLKRDWFRPSPPYRNVMWSMRNNTNYMQTGVLSALQLASNFPEVILENFYKKSANGVYAGTAKAPYAYVIPAGQADQTRVKFVVDQLMMQGIEIGKATGPLKFKEGEYPAGSLIVKLDQPYGRLAKTLLKIQDNYPNENLTTYDDAAWTMGLMTGTKIVEIDDKSALGVATTPVTSFDPVGSVASAGPGGFVVLDTGSVNLAVLRYRLKDVSIRVAEKPFKIGRTAVPAGSYIVPASAASALRPAVQELGLTAIAAPTNVDVSTHEIPVPRTAVFSTWGGTEKVGWVRYAFDQYETPYDLIYKEQVRGGNLRAKYDVIVLPHQARSTNDIVFDIPVKGKPLPYKPSEQFKTLGTYGQSDDIRGGMGLEGLAELRKFVEQGGTLITTGNASAVPASFGLVNDITVGTPGGNFYAPGPIVKAKVLQPLSPIFYGYTEETMPVRWATNALFGVRPANRQQVLMEFPGGKASVVSGFMRGAEEVRNRPAIINVPTGQGRVLMFATSPIWRWQTLGEYRMLYNAMLNWKALGGVTGMSPKRPDPGLPLDATPEQDDGSKPTNGDGS